MKTEKVQKTKLQSLGRACVLLYSVLFGFAIFCDVVTLYVGSNFVWILQDLYALCLHLLLGSIIGCIFALQYLVQKYIKNNSTCYFLLLLLQVLQIFSLNQFMIEYFEMGGVTAIFFLLIAVYLIYTLRCFLECIKERSMQNKNSLKTVGKITILLHSVFAMVGIVVAIVVSSSTLLLYSKVWILAFAVQCLLYKCIKIRGICYPILIVVECIHFVIGAMLLVNVYLHFIFPIAMLLVILYCTLLFWNILFFKNAMQVNRYKKVEKDVR